MRGEEEWDLPVVFVPELLLTLPVVPLRAADSLFLRCTDVSGTAVLGSCSSGFLEQLFPCLCL